MKVFILADQLGYMYNFDLYTGPLTDHSSAGLETIESVLHISSNVDSNRRHILVMDNWFGVTVIRLYHPLTLLCRI